MRNPIFIQGDKFAVYHGVAFHAFERFRNLDVAVADDLAVAAVKGDLARLDVRDHAKPVVLILEHPFFVVERGVRERRKHGLQSFWQRRRPAHSLASCFSALQNVMQYRRPSTPGMLCSQLDRTVIAWLDGRYSAVKSRRSRMNSTKVLRSASVM